MKKKFDIHPSILKIKEKIIDNRRYFHKYPELSFQEFNTSKVIKQKLEEMGIEVTSGIAKTGLTGMIRGANEGKTIALRADMDALPIQETSDIDYKSVNNILNILILSKLSHFKIGARFLDVGSYFVLVFSY